MKKIIVTVILLGIATCLMAAPYAEIKREIAYRPNDPLNLLDLYYPQIGHAPYPTHIYIHGGGWVGGTKRVGGLQANLFKKLAEKGFLGVSVEYRKVNASQNIYMRESTVDSLDAIRYLVAHAKELKIDTQNIFVWGGSAGGHLALMAATAVNNPELSDSPELSTIPVEIRGALAWFPPCDMENYETISIEKNQKLRLLSNRMGRKLEDDPDAYKEISPLHNLSSDCPPVLIFHGDKDLIVHEEHSLRFKQKADQLNADCTLQIVHNAGHGFSNDDLAPNTDEIIQTSVNFFTGRATPPD